MDKEESKLGLGGLYAILVDGPIAVWRYLKDHEDRIKALEAKLPPETPHFTWTKHATGDHFTQANLDAAVRAERERCAAIVVNEYRPYPTPGQQVSSERLQAVCQRIKDRIEAGDDDVKE